MEIFNIFTCNGHFIMTASELLHSLVRLRKCNAPLHFATGFVRVPPTPEIFLESYRQTQVAMELLTVSLTALYFANRQSGHFVDERCARSLVELAQVVLPLVGRVILGLFFIIGDVFTQNAQHASCQIPGLFLVIRSENKSRVKVVNDSVYTV